MLKFNNGFFHPNFVPDGVEGGGSATGSSSEHAENAPENTGSSSSEVKPDVKPEVIPAHDEKGVPYYNRYREMEEKFKGVDLDKWKQLSGIDLTVYKSEREWMDMLMQEKDLYSQVLSMIKGYKKPAPAQASAESKELADIREKMESLEKWKSSTEAEKEALVAEQVRNEYDTRYSKELSDSMKSKNIQSLSAIEKQWLRSSVDDEYRRDWQESQVNKSQPKLGWNELPKIVKKYMDAVDSARRESLKGSVRKDGSPDAINGGGPSQFMKKPDARETKAERVSRIANEMKDKMAHSQQV